ncbi:hypothetical protein C7M84_012253 [Penaeus vannamei]|uniref:Uncharacterized protein n=1 Tax=Penaeus vannamei TaxID=6689 RepID=A0A423SZE7_PENVA|nr:hypothetical protein C7M84_012253 [Penaeus vannamei]
MADVKGGLFAKTVQKHAGRAKEKELYQELPELFDQRIPNVAAHLQTLFAAESTFMSESSKVAKELEAIVEKLSKECAKGTYKTKESGCPRPLSMAVDSPPSHHQKSPGSPSILRGRGAPLPPLGAQSTEPVDGRDSFGTDLRYPRCPTTEQPRTVLPTAPARPRTRAANPPGGRGGEQKVKLGKRSEFSWDFWRRSLASSW